MKRSSTPTLMAPTRNGRVLFNEVPSGYAEDGKTTIYNESQTVELDSVSLSGGVLVKTLALSIDPYLRGLMREPDASLYGISYLPGQPIYNTGIGRVLRSEHPLFMVGEYVTGMLDFQEYNIIPSVRISAGGYYAIVKTEKSLPWTVYLGAAALTGRTAFCGYREFITPNLKTGGVIFVSTGAGAVGSIVVQLAKRDGLKVIASAGSDEKVKFLKDLGVDVAFNYKTTETRRLLKKEGPIDFYWDNVGGATLDTVLSCMSIFGRVVSCGMSSIYNDGMQGYNFQHLWEIFARHLTIYGFAVANLQSKYDEEFTRTIPPMLASGELQYRQDITRGLQGTGHALHAIQVGENVGKSVVLVAED